MLFVRHSNRIRLVRGLDLTKAVEWYCASSPGRDKKICTTRDVFQARLDTFYQEVIRALPLDQNEIALLSAAVGEIGNNCFDHNLGQWPDEIGCWFELAVSSTEVFVVVADRGQGVLNSLKRVKPDLKNEPEALKIAFEKRLSGRSPEQRGNGLKFVRSVINGNPARGLLFFSGKAEVLFGGNRSFKNAIHSDTIGHKAGTGTLALLSWGKP